MQRRDFFSRRDTSPIILLVALALVAGAVAIGVFGRRLEERATQTMIPLGDIADAARQIQARMQFEAIHRQIDAAPPTRAELATIIDASLKSEWRPPDLGPSGFVPILAGPVEMPGEIVGVVILFERLGDLNDRFLTIFVLNDNGQFATFDEYGKIEPLMTARSIMELDDQTNPNSGATLAFSDGALLFIVRADDMTTLDDIRGALGAP